MHEAAGAPPQRTNGGCAAAQSTGAAALRGILQARPLALQVHGEPAIVDKSTAWCAVPVDHHDGRALRRDNRGPRRRLLGRGPAVRVADPEEADPAHPREAMPWVSHERRAFSIRPALVSKTKFALACA